MSKNILELCLSPDLGGLEIYVVDYFEFIQEKTNSFLVIQKNKKIDNYIKNKKSIFYLKRNRLLPIFPALKLAKFIDKNNIDIIHFHWTKDINIAVLAKYFSKKNPKIVQSRHMTMTRFKNDFYHKWLYKNIDLMHCVTKQVRNQLEKFIPAEVLPIIKDIYPGVKSSVTKDDNIKTLKSKYNINNEFIVGIVGRIEEAKGQYLLIEAVSQLENFNIKVLIVGQAMNEEYVEKLKELSRNLNIEDKIIFTGFTKDVNTHMRLFDINVLATPKETFGLVIIEAMINKVCVIATNNGGPLEIIDDNKTGLLFNRTSDELARKIKFLIENKEFKNEIANNAYQNALLKFNSSTQFKKLYQEIGSI